MSVSWAMSEVSERQRKTMTRAVVVKAGWVFRQSEDSFSPFYIKTILYSMLS